MIRYNGGCIQNVPCITYDSVFDKQPSWVPPPLTTIQSILTLSADRSQHRPFRPDCFDDDYVARRYDERRHDEQRRGHPAHVQLPPERISEIDPTLELICVKVKEPEKR